MTEHKPLLQTLVYGIALAVLIGWVLYVARDVLVPVAYSALLVYVVLGMTRQMARIPGLGPRLPEALRYLVSAAVILAAVWGVTLLVLASIAEITTNAARYDRATLGAIQRAATWLDIETEPTWRWRAGSTASPCSGCAWGCLGCSFSMATCSTRT